MDDLDFSQFQADLPANNHAELLCRYIFEDETGVAPAIFWADPDAHFQLTLSSPACRHWGIAWDAASHKTLQECIPSLSKEKLLQLWQQVGELGKTFFETEYTLTTGRRIAIEIVFSRASHEGKELLTGHIRDITERRVLENERQRLAIEVSQKEAELRFREIFENVTDGIFLLDVVNSERFRFSAFNPAMARITGYLPMEVAGRFVEEVIPQPGAQRLIANFRQCVTSEQPLQYEIVLEFPAGQRILESLLVPVRNDRGQIYRIIGLTSDVTLRKQAEREIGFMNFSLDHMHDAVFLVDTQQRFRYVNQRACDVLGYSKEELLNLRLADIDPEVELGGAGYMNDSEHLRFETHHRTKSGKTFPVEISSSLIQYNDEPMRFAVVRDITDRKAMEEELRWQADFQQSLLNAVYDVGMQVLVIEDNRVVHVGNRSVARQLGFSDTELDAPIELARFIHPDDVARVYEYQSRRRAGLFAPPRYEVGVIGPNGRKMDYEVAIAVVPGTTPVRMVAVGQDITRRRQAEETLHTSEAQMRFFFEHRMVGMAITSAEKKWIKVNDKACDLLGYPREELMALTLNDIAHREDIDSDETQFNRMLAGEIDSYKVEKRYVRKDGKLVYVHLGVSCVRSADHRVEYVLVVLEDDSARKQAEIAMHESRHLLAEAERIAHLGSWSLDHKSDSIRLSEEMSRILGDEHDDKVTALLDVVHPDDIEELQRVFGASMMQKQPFEMEHRLLLRGGRIKYVYTRGEHQYAEDGTCLRSLCITQDVTHLKQTQHHLDTIHSRLHTMIHTMPDYVWLKDGNGVYLTCNHAFERFFGAPEAEIIGKTDYDFVEAELADFFLEKDRAAMQAGQVCINEEWITLAQDGRRTLLETRKVPVYDDTGNIQGVLGIARGITEHKLRDERMALMDYALNQVSDALYLINEQARFVQVNEAACRMLGYSQQELLSLGIFDIDPNFDSERWDEHWRLFHRGQARFFIETHHRRKNSEVFEVEVYANHINYQGTHYVLSLVHDVSARKGAETLLRRRDAELRTLVQNLSTCIVKLDRDYRRTFVNPAYIAVLGADESRILGTHVSEFWHAQNMTAEAFVEILQRVMTTGNAEDVMLEWSSLSGDFYSQLVRVAPEYTPEGTIPGVIALGFDMTERRRQEIIEQHRQQVLELMAQNAGLDHVLRRIEQFVAACKPGSTCCVRSVPQAPTDEIGAILHVVHHVHGSTSSERQKHCPDPDLAGFTCPEHCLAMECSGWQHRWSEPVNSTSGELLGAVTLYHDKSETLADSDHALLKQAAHLVAIALERKRIEDRMELQTSFDALTGLPNRRLFGIRLHEDVSKAERNKARVALLFIDLDRFKEVNDTLGHDVGDRLLIESAQRIRQCVRASDTVARLSGDEFVVSIADYVEAVQIARLSQQIVEALSRPFMLDENRVYVSASVGIACYPDDADDLNMLSAVRTKPCMPQRRRGGTATVFSSLPFRNKRYTECALPMICGMPCKKASSRCITNPSSMPPADKS